METKASEEAEMDDIGMLFHMLLQRPAWKTKTGGSTAESMKPSLH